MAKIKKKAKKYHIEFTAFSASCWGIFLLFLLAWIFVLGILVGRGFLPGSVSTTISDLRSQIEKLQDMVRHEEKYDSRVAKEIDESPKLAFYEKLATKKNEVKDNWKNEEKEDITNKNEVTSEPVELQGETGEKIEREIAEVELDEQMMSDSDFKYTIQIFSLGEKEKAESMIKELVDKGYDAYYYAVEVEGKTYYRINCGRFQDMTQALRYSKKLEMESGYKGFVKKID
jgi:septal ring-binding cell division protein DamX